MHDVEERVRPNQNIEITCHAGEYRRSQIIWVAHIEPPSLVLKMQKLLNAPRINDIICGPRPILLRRRPALDQPV